MGLRKYFIFENFHKTFFTYRITIMRKTAFIVLTVLLVSVVASFKSGMSADLNPSVDRHMKRVIQLTFEGDNGEA
jgi:hypothetical protein